VGKTGGQPDSCANPATEAGTLFPGRTLLAERSAGQADAFRGRTLSWRLFFRAIRPHQWAKNLLIFVPLFLSHKIFQLPLATRALLAFVAFSLAASSLYIINDLLDIEADRNHPRKKYRPLASGELSIPAGLTLAAVLGAAGIFVSVRLPWSAGLLLAGYCMASLAYSAYLKKHLFVDVVLLAAFFAVRLLFGGAATGIEISVWTLAFSMFLFLSLALMKRLTELRNAPEPSKSGLSRRGYLAEDLQPISALSCGSGLLSVMVLAFYIQSAEVHALYSHPLLLWLVCPLLLYWIGRFAILANRGYIHHDPIVFAFNDPASLLTGALTLAVVLCAI